MPKKISTKNLKNDEDNLDNDQEYTDKLEDEIDDTEDINSEDDEEEDNVFDEAQVQTHAEADVHIQAEDDEYIDDNEEIEVQPDTTVEYVKKEDRQSSAKLTKYEMVRILGERTKQLTMGAKALVKNHKDLPYERIAEEELKLNMIPFKIRRPLPNGKYEIWTLDELNKDHLMALIN